MDIAHFGVKIGKAQRYVGFLQLSEEFGAQSAFYPYLILLLLVLGKVRVAQSYTRS